MTNGSTDLLDLALKLAPELASAGLCLLRHLDSWIAPARAEAYAISGKHLDIRAELQRRGQWTGSWGSYIVFVKEPTADLLVHELSHLLPARTPILDNSDEPTPEQAGFQRGQLLAWTAMANDWTVEPWRGHDLRWIRRALHVAYRAELAGINVDLTGVGIAGPRYGLSMAWDYQRELASEPMWFTRKTFAEIDAAPMPSGFVKLFARDVAEYYHDYYLDKFTYSKNS